MKRLLTIITIFVLLAVPQFTLASDVDVLKAEVDKFLQAFNSLDTNAISKMAQPELTVYNTDSPFPQIYSTTDAFKNDMQSWFSGLESLNVILVDPKYKVVGNTGIIIGYETLSAKPKDGPSTTSYYRITMTFVKLDGNWRALSIHLSYLPPGKP